MDQSPAAAAQRLAFNKRALFLAVKTGDTETVADLLDGGVPIGVRNDVGMSLLHGAAQGGHVTTVRLLIRRGCDVNSTDGRGLTPLHLAAAMGQTKAVRELIRKGASKSVVAILFGSPLHLAVFRGHVETVVAMLEEGCPIDAVNSVGTTVLHMAAQGGHVELVRELVGRGCDVNAVQANGCTPLHDAAGCGKTEAACELINLDATRSVVAGMYGAPLHQAAIAGHMETVIAMLEEGCPIDAVDSDGATVLHCAARSGHVELVRELVGRGCDVNAMCADGWTPLHSAAACGRTEAVCELIKLDATKSSVVVHDAMPSRPQVCECGIIGTRNSFGQTPVMLAASRGQVEVFKLLTSKGGCVSDRDTHSLSSFELCVASGYASKLSKFCEACGIVSSGQELRGALATLINQDLVDARKVLCLCAFSGDSVFLEDQFIELVASDACAMPEAVRLAKQVFKKGIPFLNQLRLSDESTLGPLHMCLLSLKCFEMYSRTPVHAMGYTSFITKLLSHPVLKKAVHENFPNGLSPLDLAQQFELHHVAALIEVAGGRPGVWADIPQEIEARRPLDLLRVKEAYPSIKAIVDSSELGLEFICSVFSSVLQQPLSDSLPLLSAEQLRKDSILNQMPTLSNLVRLIASQVSTQNWKLVGLMLLEDIADCEGTLNAISHQFSDDKNRFLEMLRYWLEHGSSVTWKTLLNVLGHFETKHTVDELADKIVSVLGGGHQVSVQVLCVE